jgi:DNA-binding LacI/PurR family transcriptional regulator
MGERITLNEIAQMAGVSKATASYVLNGREKANRISTETAVRVRETAAKFGYVLNRAAAQLKKGRHHLIALMAPHFSDFYAGLLQSIEQVAEERGYQTLFGSTFDSVEREKTYLNNLIARRVDGIILLPVDIFQPHLKLLTTHRVPSILFRRRASSKSPLMFMTFDDFEAGALAARHLSDRGCKRMAFLSSPVYVEQEYLSIIHQARLQGFNRTLKESGMPVPLEEAFMLTRGDAVSEHALVETFRKHRIDGFAAISDDIAVWAMRLLQDAGVRIPDQVRAAGCNNSELSVFAVPGLTSVGLPKARLGEEMVRVLFRMIDRQEQETDELLIEPHLVERDSTTV